jgi:hypothetical protein
MTLTAKTRKITATRVPSTAAGISAVARGRPPNQATAEPGHAGVWATDEGGVGCRTTPTRPAPARQLGDPTAVNARRRHSDVARGSRHGHTDRAPHEASDFSGAEEVLPALGINDVPAREDNRTT